MVKKIMLLFIGVGILAVGWLTYPIFFQLIGSLNVGQALGTTLVLSHHATFIAAAIYFFSKVKN